MRLSDLKVVRLFFCVFAASTAILILSRKSKTIWLFNLSVGFWQFHKLGFFLEWRHLMLWKKLLKVLRMKDWILVFFHFKLSFLHIEQKFCYDQGVIKQMCSTQNATHSFVLFLNTISILDCQLSPLSWVESKNAFIFWRWKLKTSIKLAT